jgi:hypothetical protein
MPGEPVCAHGHPQPALATAHARLHVSGFDPRAAGGRHTLKLELLGLPPELAPCIDMRIRARLPLQGEQTQTVTRTRCGRWAPVFVEFSSRGVEHGQHRIEIELQGASIGGAVRRAWVGSLVVHLPRHQASLADIHQAFLASHKNVRIVANDGSIARVQAPGEGRLDIEVDARDASIAQLKLDAQGGSRELGMASIAWDEELIEVEPCAAQASHPWPLDAACLVNAHAGCGLPRHMRLFALDQFVLGRFDPGGSAAQVQLCHFAANGADKAGLTRRISSRHAVIRRGRDGYEIEDLSRYGLLVEGVWPGRQVAAPLRLGMRIELTARIPGIVTLMVTAVLPNGLVLHRTDGGAAEECFCLLEPERQPDRQAASRTLAQAARLPRLYHRDGGFWLLDGERACALVPDVPLANEGRRPGQLHLAGGPYPERWTARAPRLDRRRAAALAHG